MNKTIKNIYNRVRYRKGGGITLRKPLLPISPKVDTDASQNIDINSPKLPIFPPGPRPSINIIPTKYNFNPEYIAKRKNIINKIIKEDTLSTKKNNKNKGRFVYPKNEYPVNKFGKISMSYFPLNNVGFKRNTIRKGGMNDNSNNKSTIKPVINVEAEGIRPIYKFSANPPLTTKPYGFSTENISSYFPTNNAFNVNIEDKYNFIRSELGKKIQKLKKKLQKKQSNS
jgi:hypothetical protein